MTLKTKTQRIKSISSYDTVITSILKGFVDENLTDKEKYYLSEKITKITAIEEAMMDFKTNEN
tara:strand:- start:660 stop:848 length:189 start_codon:yes stop_codon:yes gene_type:complete